MNNTCIIYNTPSNNDLKNFYDKLCKSLYSKIENGKLYKNIFYNKVYSLLYKYDNVIMIGNGDMYGLGIDNNKKNSIQFESIDIYNSIIYEFSKLSLIWQDSDICLKNANAYGLSMSDFIITKENANYNNIHCTDDELLESNNLLIDCISDILFEYNNIQIASIKCLSNFYLRILEIMKEKYSDCRNPIIEYNQNTLIVNFI